MKSFFKSDTVRIDLSRESELESSSVSNMSLIPVTASEPGPSSSATVSRICGSTSVTAEDQSSIIPFSIKIEVCEGEIIWSVRVIEKNMSCWSCSDIAETFKLMF